ncbi:hypothetical protein GcM1_220037 [Golovinomyces cichoracearum]|uniref:Uncharacterized protein n=1 Tax=Golovinomyces cichoracearum TaxID=62708 RepID=A0A420IS35_9PEZI|nr:hypothetical protein GcM1_220037 [Golovinomyces cichoracearum]
MNLRRKFRFPTDDDQFSDGDLQSGEILDEEEQENLIQSLEIENRTANQLHLRALLLLPLISILPYIRSLFSPGTAIFSVLSITSLLSTAYLLVSVLHRSDATAINPLSQPSFQSPLPRNEAYNLLSTSQGPIKKFLPYLNLGLCFSLAVLGILINNKYGDLWLGFCWLPAINYGAVILTTWYIAIVDPQAELKKLKYTYRGA